MYYYKWPLVGTGSNEYTWIGSKLSADFSEAPFRWYEMLPYYVSNGLTEDMVLAVSDLLYKCGISVNMSYGLGESSASDAWIPGALKNYFGYSSARMINRSDYSEEDWISLLKGNLQKKMPVIYSGYHRSARPRNSSTGGCNHTSPDLCNGSEPAFQF